MKRLAKMVPPIIGGCACGAMRYTCSSSPVWSCNCHCNACKRLSGAPFVSAFSVRSEDLHLTGNETSTFERQADSGHRVSTVHCRKCGTRFFAQSEGNKALVGIFATTLDDPSTFVPISNVYVSEAAHWIVPDASLMSFPKMPGR